jgi:3-hydroxybutyryl-CoA dehydrogenase
MTIPFALVGIVGAGAMGRGIAQVVAQAGIEVRLFDTRPGAAIEARDAVVAQWHRLQSKGKADADRVTDWTARLTTIDGLDALSGCDLVIEAIVERLDAKQELFVRLESLTSPDCVLATNTSSLSVTAIAAALRLPERLAGLHYFNPVPLMKVAEVIAGLRTDPEVCDRLMAFVEASGHRAVRARDTPGFIVNHAGRGYGTEALRVLAEGVTDAITVDRILRDQAGFRLGPFELLDLTGLDVSHPAMESIYRQYYEEPRFRPSVITAQRLAAGQLGRKSGSGFYPYPGGAQQVAEEPATPQVKDIPPVWVSSRAARRSELLQLLKDLGARIETGQNPSPNALTLVAPLGFDITTVAVVERLDPARTVGIDMLIDDGATHRRVLATTPATRADMRDAAHALFARDGKPVSVIRDSGGFVTQRVLAMIINIASDICQQRICSPSDLETAVTLGLGYPSGPLAWGDRLGPTNILEVLFNLQTVYGDPRYRPSPWLRRRGALGLSLSQEED